MKDFFYKHFGIISFIASILCIIIGSVFEFYKLLALGIVFLVGIIIGYGMIYFLDFLEFFTKKIKTRKYQKINAKKNKSLWEFLYLDAYNDNASRDFNNYIKVMKISGINNVNIAPTSLGYIGLKYKPRGYDVFVCIYKDKLVYTIDTPYKFDYVLDNDDFEKRNVVNISINECSSLNDFYEKITVLLLQINDSISKFNNENESKINLPLKKIEEIRYFRFENKIMAIIILVLSSILVGFLFWLTYNLFIDESVNLLLILLVIGIDLLFLFVVVYSIMLLLYIGKISKDLGNQEISNIICSPYKVSFGDSRGKYSRVTNLHYLRLHICDNDKKYKLLMICNYSYKKINKKEIGRLIKEKKFTFKYLNNSLIIVSGSDYIDDLIKLNISL